MDFLLSEDFEMWPGITIVIIMVMATAITRHDGIMTMATVIVMTIFSDTDVILIVIMKMVMMMVMMMDLLNKQPISFVQLLKPNVVVEWTGLEVQLVMTGMTSKLILMTRIMSTVESVKIFTN